MLCSYNDNSRRNELMQPPRTTSITDVALLTSYLTARGGWTSRAMIWFNTPHIAVNGDRYWSQGWRSSENMGIRDCWLPFLTFTGLIERNGERDFSLNICFVRFCFLFPLFFFLTRGKLYYFPRICSFCFIFSLFFKPNRLLGVTIHQKSWAYL